MYQPITPVIPLPPRFTSLPDFDVLRELEAEVLPVLEHCVDLAVGHRLEVRLALGDAPSTLTLQPSFFSSTYLTT